MDFHNVVRLPSESTFVMRHVSLATVYWQDGCGAL